MKPLAQNTLIQSRYLIVHLIGKGGMGEVYLAVDQRLGSAVALKRTYFAGDEMLGNAFEREARTLARMRHPVLPKVSDHFGEGDEQYLVMEHIAGDDLAKRLEAAQKPFPVSWVMFWADQLLDALSYLHSHEPPIIHRDIKPQNLKLTDENHIILLDFGLSKTSTGQTHISNTGSTGSVVGYTPHYAPMEQIRGIGTSPRSDLYSLSATLYQLMTNVVPDDALSRADAMLNGMSDPIEPPHTLNPEIPASVSEVILKGMEVSQEKRFGNARDMQKALRRAFTKMQEAMAAQTVAFNLGDMEPLASAVEKTQLMPSEPISLPQPEARSASIPSDHGAVDLDATLAFDPEENYEQARQAGIKTEVFSPPGETNGAVAPPAVDLPTGDEVEDDMHTSFVTVVAGAQSSEVLEAEAAIASSAPAPAAVAAVPAKKSSGRAFAILGGLAAFLVLGTGAAAASWYFYTNYYSATAIVEPSPSPEPTVAATPLVELPVETVTETNTATETNSDSDADSSADSNSNAQPSTGEAPSVRAESDTTPSRSNPTAARVSNRTATTPTSKEKPKPKTTQKRTDILQ
jgi:serine/threonine protein kinase